MANYKSSKKRIIVNERNHQRNIKVRSRVKTAMKKVHRAIENNESDQLEELFKRAVIEIDKAGSKGVYHKNNVARKKSRLSAVVAKAKA